MIDIGKNKISVIIPVYNVFSQLDDTLHSVTCQTHENMEIILVDDGSNDGSSEICDRWADKDSRIRCIHQSNAGVSVARNTGLKASGGEFILFIDGDDEIAPDMCGKLLRQLILKDADVSYCGYLNIWNDQVIRQIPEEKTIEGMDAIIEELFIEPSFFSAVWNKLFKKDILKNECGEFIQFSLGIYVGEDFLWLSKVLKNAKKISSVPEALYCWKRRLDGMIRDGKARTDEEYMTVLEAYQEIMADVKEKELKKFAYKNYLATCRDCMIQAYQEEKYKLCDELAGEILANYKSYGKMDFFQIKLILCIILVKIRASYALIEKVHKMKRRNRNV